MGKIFNKVKKILVDELGVEENAIESSASFIDDLNMDTGDIAEFFTSVEDVFSKPGNKIEIPEEESDELITVQNLVDYLQEMGVED